MLTKISTLSITLFSDCLTSLQPGKFRSHLFTLSFEWTNFRYRLKQTLNLHFTSYWNLPLHGH